MMNDTFETKLVKQKISTDDRIISKPHNDKCNYHTFCIEKNKLNVFLVEDTDTDYACVTMLVKIGHMYDPILGMAHFLEHMLFNGTKKFPDENHFMTYITSNGGYSNAYTSHDHTCYYYTIQPKMLLDSLEIFSSFFEEPLLKADSVNREKEAVDAEHSKNKFNDAWRLNEIVRKACVESHPIKNFGTGSNKTLGIANIDEHVRNFFESYYSSDLMTLVIVSKDPIEIVKNKVMSIFENIPLRITEQNRKIYSGKILDAPKIIKVVPIQSVEKITMYWDIPSFNKTPLASPISFISHLLGHEGKGTIHYFLTQMGYISRLFAGPFQQISDRCIFQLDITLTPAGTNYRNEIIYVVMQYIELIKSQINSEHLKLLYNEILTLNAFKFKYMTKCSSEQRAIEYCKLINEYVFDLHDLLILPYANENYEPNVKNNIIEVLNDMKLEKLVITFVSNKFNNECILEDPDYGTKYNMYNEFPKFTELFDTSSLSLPQLNPFVSIGENIVKQTYKKPVKINIDNTQSYWLATQEFCVPDAMVKVKINLPLSNSNKQIHTKSQLYINALLIAINHEKYLCDMAGYGIDIYLEMGKLYITVNGNYQKITNVCEFIVNSILNSDLITEMSFNNAKFIMKEKDMNSIYKPPYSRLSVFFCKKMCSKFYDNIDRLSVIDDITIDDVKKTITEILLVNSLTMIVSGNIIKETSYNITNIFKKLISKSSYKYDIPVSGLFNTPIKSDEIVYYKVENEHETDCAMGYYVFFDKIRLGTTKDWNKIVCLSNIIDNLLGVEYFDKLRTKEKYGYVVNGSIQSFGDKNCLSRYYVFTTQSPHKSAKQMIERTNDFLIEAREKILKSTQDDINRIIQSFVSVLESPCNNLTELTQYVFDLEMESEYYKFDSKKIFIDTYKKVLLDDVIKFYDKYFTNKKIIAIGLNGNSKFK